MADLDIPTARQLIDGDWTAAADGGELPVLDPATRETIQSVARARAVDIDHAVAAARRAARLGGDLAQRARRDPAPLGRPDRRARRAARRARVA